MDEIEISELEEAAGRYDYIFKILVVGMHSVGKSSLLLRLTDDTFRENTTSTIGVDFKIRDFKVTVANRRERIVKLQIYDTAGQERFNAITRQFFKGAHGALLVYDITQKCSFDALHKWLEDLEANRIPKVTLVGNKVDAVQQRAVSREEAERWGVERDMEYIETSAKTGQGVTAVFEQLICEMVTSSESAFKMDNEKNDPNIKLLNGQKSDEKNVRPDLRRTCC